MSRERLRLLTAHPGEWFACETPGCDWVQMRSPRAPRAHFTFVPRAVARTATYPLRGEPRQGGAEDTATLDTPAPELGTAPSAPRAPAAAGDPTPDEAPAGFDGFYPSQSREAPAGGPAAASTGSAAVVADGQAALHGSALPAFADAAAQLGLLEERLAALTARIVAWRRQVLRRDGALLTLTAVGITCSAMVLNSAVRRAHEPAPAPEVPVVLSDRAGGSLAGSSDAGASEVLAIQAADSSGEAPAPVAGRLADRPPEDVSEGGTGESLPAVSRLEAEGGEEASGLEAGEAARGVVAPPRGYRAVSLHTRPTTAAPLVAMLPQGSVVTMLGDTAQGGGYAWVRVRTGQGQEGWLIATALRPG